MALSDTDLQRLRQCVDLAHTAVEHGHSPFGAMLVDADGHRLVCDHNRSGTGDPTQHPELAIARWAAANLAPDRRLQTTVYTSCEQCPMCASAHAWVGLGRIVYATSLAQVNRWLTECGAPTLPGAALPVTAVAPAAIVEGPAPGFDDEMKTLYQAAYRL